MRNFIFTVTGLLVLHFVCYNVLARPDQKMMMMTTEEPKITEQSTVMITNLTDGEDDFEVISLESVEDETEETASSEEDKITTDSKTAFVCPSKPLEITDLESQCLAEYKAMKKAKCNTTEEKTKKISTVELMESDSHALHMGKREVSMADDMMNTTETTTKTAVTHQRKRSCYYYRCILKKLDVLDETTMLPNEDMFNTWVANNITDEGEKERLQERVKECFNELRESGFYNTESSKPIEVLGETPNVKKGKTSCNAALKLLKCLSKQDSQCPTQFLG